MCATWGWQRDISRLTNSDNLVGPPRARLLRQAGTLPPMYWYITTAGSARAWQGGYRGGSKLPPAYPPMIALELLGRAPGWALAWCNSNSKGRTKIPLASVLLLYDVAERWNHSDWPSYGLTDRVIDPTRGVGWSDNMLRVSIALAGRGSWPRCIEGVGDFCIWRGR